MLGAIAGDIIGSVYEHSPIKTTDFPLFSPGSTYTDDSVLTIALADTILTGTTYAHNLKEYYLQYPHAGFGGSFHRWAASNNTEPYNSWGNGAAMRISPAGFAYEDLQTVLKKAEEFTAVTHNHPEGIRGGQATAAAVFLARTGNAKEQIKQYIMEQFQYDLSGDLSEIRRTYSFDVSCQGTVPPALIAFLESSDYEDSIRLAISLGGDADTLACITGAVAHAFYGSVPESIEKQAYETLDNRLSDVTRRFMERFGW